MTESASSSTEANDGPMGARIFSDSFEKKIHSFKFQPSACRSVSFDEYWYGVDKRASWTRKKNQTEQEEKGVYSNYSCSSEGNKFINIITKGMLKEFIKSELPRVSPCSDDFAPNVLVQLWASVVTSRGGRCVLTTRNLPFSLGRNEGRLYEYRKHCISRQINVNLNLDDDDDDGDDDDDEEEFGGGGVIGRVFRHKQVESTPDVSYYSTKEYPQRDIALKFGIKRSLALPVFQLFDGSCFGVLEQVNSLELIDILDRDPFNHFSRALYQEAIIEMKYLKASLPLELQIEQGANEEIQEINKALQLVCTAHQLPLAQIWIPGRPRLARTCVDSSMTSCHLYCSYEFSSVLRDDDNERLYDKLIMLNHICNLTYLTKGQGIVDKALLYGKPYFCRDVSQLPITEYMLSHYMRKYGLTGCFAICIHGSPTKDRDYVLEFFLPPCNTISEDPQTFLKPILATAKRHLQGFEIYSGGPGEELHVEVINISVNDEPDNIRICQATGIQPIHGSSQNEREELQNKVTGEVVIDYGSNVFGAEQNDMGRGCLDKREEMLEEERENEVGKDLVAEVAKTSTNVEITTILPPPRLESLQNEIEVVQLSGDEETIDSFIENVLNVMVPEQNDVAVTSDREQKTNELSHEDLKQNLGKMLEDGANSFGVNRSSGQHELKTHKFDKWPLPKKTKKANNASSTSNLKHGKEVVPKKRKKVNNPSSTSNLKHVKEVREELLVEAASNDEITTEVSPAPESLQNETEVVQLSEDESTIEAVTKNEVNEIEVVQLSDDESCGATATSNESNVLVAAENNIAATCSVRTCRVGTSKREHVTNDEVNRLHLKQRRGKKLDDVAESPGVIKNELNAGIAEESCVPVLTSSGSISRRAEASEKIEYRTTNFSLSREDLVKHFGEKLDDVAAFYKVHRSTIQRELRKHGIEKWPPPMRKKVNAPSTSNLEHLKEVVPNKRKEVNAPSTSNLQHVKEVVQKKEVKASSTFNIEHVKEVVPKKMKKVNAPSTSNLEHVKEVVPKKRKKGNPLCSTPPPMLTTETAVVARTIRNAPPEQDVGIMDTKVRYGDTTIRFNLPVTATKQDLLEMVTQRLTLTGVSFNIEYQDEENEWILIAIDKDLENSIRISRSLGKRPMLVLKISSLVP